MTKENYIDEIISILGRIDNTRRLHPKVIEAHITGAVNDVLSRIYEANPSDVSVYTKTYENVALGDDKVYLTDDYTSTGNAIHLIQLPRVGGGVMSVRPSDDTDVLFFPMRLQDVVAYERMHSTNYNTDIGFVVRGNELQIIGDTTITEVDVDLVRSFEEYDYDEEFYIPFERKEDVINLVLQKAGIVQPVSLKNNNSDESASRSQERSS